MADETTKFLLPERDIPTHWINLLPDLPGRAAAAAEPGHEGARRPRRPDADLPDGADRAGGLDRAGDRDPRGGARGLQAVAPDAAATAPAGSSGRSIPRRTSTTSTRASRPPARTSPTPRSRRPTRTRRRASAKLATETGAGQWGSALAFACALFGIECEVFMVGVELRPEALPPLDDGDVGRDRAPLARRDLTEAGALAGRAPDRLARHRDLRGGRGRRAGRRHELLARLGAQPRAACTRR